MTHVTHQSSIDFGDRLFPIAHFEWGAVMRQLTIECVRQRRCSLAWTLLGLEANASSSMDSIIGALCSNSPSCFLSYMQTINVFLSHRTKFNKI